MRRSYRDIFLSELTRLSRNGTALVGNGAFRKTLNWDQERYDRIKSQLLFERAIVLGKGKGGSLRVPVAPILKPRGLTVFIAYSHADGELQKELVKHLEPLRRLHRIEAWYDQRINPGDEWEKAIEANLTKADIILLLVSIDFINSRYCYEVELEKAMDRNARKEATVVPVILRRCQWQYMPFAKLQALPSNGTPINSWSDRDDALTNVAEGLLRVTDTLLPTESG
jgi:hypothetical protein